MRRAGIWSWKACALRLMLMLMVMVMVMLAPLTASVAAAQDAAPPAAPAAAEAADGAPAEGAEAGAGRGATTFQPASASEEKTSGYALMVAAYLVMWLLLALYALTLWRRQRGIGRELDGLRARLQALDEALGGKGKPAK